MIFLTVGTQFPFDRLVKAVDDIASRNALEEQLFGQIGTTSYHPMSFQAVASLEKTQFDIYLRKAKAIISHAGMGTILMALEYEKPLLVMPRLRKYGEAVNNHQVDIARRFEQLGHILVAYNEEEFPNKLQQLKTFVPKPRDNQARAVAERIANFLELLCRKKIPD
jgi:UDP-N-acetylglucosamine transferase subunit ALG13